MDKWLFVFTNEEEFIINWLKNKYPKKNQKKLYVKYAYILHRIIQCNIYSKDRHDQHGKSMNIKGLQELFGGTSSMPSRILEDLVEMGFIVPYLPYIPKKQSRTFKLQCKFQNAQVSMRLFSKEKHGSLIKKLVEKERIPLQNSILGRLLYTYENHVSVSLEGIEYLKSKYKSSSLESVLNSYIAQDYEALNANFPSMQKQTPVELVDMVLLSFTIKDFYVKQPDASRRCYSNICNLKREFRKYILIQGKPMLETDITNSQPTISIPVIQQALRELKGSNYVSKSMHLYQMLATTGTFYEALAAEANIDISHPVARNKFKEDFYTQVFFSKVTKWNPSIKKAFKKLFPDAFEAIQHIKRNNHNSFAIQLQTLEATVVIFDVLKQLQDEGHIVIPLHDAIYCNNNETLKRAKELIRYSLWNRYKLSISFKNDLATNFSAMQYPGASSQSNIGKIDKARAFNFFIKVEERVTDAIFERNSVLTIESVYQSMRMSIDKDGRFVSEEKIKIFEYLEVYKQENLVTMFESLGLTG